MFLWLKFKVYIIGLFGIIATMLSIYFVGKRSGVQNEFNRQSQIDNKQARKIEDAADRARKHHGDNVDAIERLRSAGKLRD
jgi:hypothetical protein